jgi:16S rRNA (cytidine1402-2'-O)-methyltransferase
MKRIYSYNKDKGILYLVATPIGNMQDMTFRAIDTLKNVDVIYAEDTRNSKYLLEHFDITTKLLSYHEYNKELKEDEIITRLKSGENVAIISDAGLPVISDPGYDIARAAIENDIPVTPIPGASAGISGLIASGITPQPFTFVGFLDSKTTKRKKELEDLKYLKSTIIFHEAPHRIKECLIDILEVFGDRYICIGRELTKKFEEFIRGNVSEIIEVADNLKGEMVVIVEGYKENTTADRDPIKEIESLINLGYKPKEAIKEVASMLNLNKQELYKQYIEYKDNK